MSYQRNESAPEVLADNSSVWHFDMPGPYVPLSLAFITALPFFCMLIGTTNDMFEARAERDMYKGQLVELLDEIEVIEYRIDFLRERMEEKQKLLEAEYEDMMEVPPDWPFETLIKDNKRPPMYVPWWVRRRYENYLAPGSKEGYTRDPGRTEPLTGPGTDGELAPSVPLRRDRQHPN